MNRQTVKQDKLLGNIIIIIIINNNNFIIIITIIIIIIRAEELESVGYSGAE